jgi:hypothetical protein
MSPVIAWSAFAGAWLLVAGPVYQAALELSAEEIEREAIAAVQKEAEPPRVSTWWWLLPPVGYLLSRRQYRAYRRDVMTSLTRSQREQLVRFTDKANGWIFIALGAFLVAIADTWQVRELYGWPLWIYVLVVAGMIFACAFNTAFRMKRSDDMLHLNDAPAGDAGDAGQPAVSG